MLTCGESRPVLPHFFWRAGYHDPDHLGIPLPPIYHQGINDFFEGKAFLVWYYCDGQWLRVAAGD